MKSRLFIFAFLVGVLVFFSCYKLTESPPLWYDEGIYNQAAVNGLGSPSIQVAPGERISTSYLTVGYPLLLPVGLAYRSFGAGVWQGRMVMVAFIVGLGLMAYALMRQLYAERVALFSLFLLATFPMLYGNGKTVIGEVPGLFFLVSCLCSLAYLERTKYQDWRWLIAVGMTAGLAAATKPIFILFLAALCLVYLVRFKNISLSLRGVVLGTTALTLPLVLWVYLQFGSDAPLGAIWSMYVNPSGVDTVRVFMQENILRFVKESTPIYTALLMLVWGAALVVRRKREHISSAELAAFLFCTLVILAYLRLEGWYRYLFPAIVIALLFLPYSCMALFEAVRKKIPSFRRAAWLPAVFILVLASGQLYQTTAASFVAEYYGSTKTRDISAALSAIDPLITVFLYNAPDTAILLPSQNYHQYLKLSSQVSLGVDQLPLLSQGVPDTVIVSADEYQKNPELFLRYKVMQAVNQDKFLTKR